MTSYAAIFRALVAAATLVVAAMPTVRAAASGAGEILEKDIPILVREVAPGLYYQYHHQESNNAFLVTDEGVLVIDTRQHPKRAEELVATIRKITDKPIRWVVNTHAHGDHYFGNSVFKREGATIIAHRDTAGMMKANFELEMKRRMGYFKQRGYDSADVKLTLPDVTFDSRYPLTIGGRQVEIFYIGAGQNPGDTFVYFPKERVLYAGGPFSKESWPNPSFTPSMQGWTEVLRKIAAMDVDQYLGGHGDIGTRQDVLNEARMLADFDAGMRAAVATGMSRDDIVKAAIFEKYKDVRNYYRMNLFISSYYHLLTTGKPENPYP
ncbi:MAG: glyoxylase-related zinc-dependent hydrolase [Betaproteobacteria bacterium]|nr:glyoxylase-related zinc-dependent hydrolase [Betaproteobacteria bacterium]